MWFCPCVEGLTLDRKRDTPCFSNLRDDSKVEQPKSLTDTNMHRRDPGVGVPWSEDTDLPGTFSDPAGNQET